MATRAAPSCTSAPQASAFAGKKPGPYQLTSGIVSSQKIGGAGMADLRAVGLGRRCS